jgi:hypothetical protein
MTLSVEQVAVVKGLLARGEKQQDIAAFFGENGGRIAEIHTGQKHSGVQPAIGRELPTPVQMVPWGFIMMEARKALEIARIGIASAEARLNEIESRLAAAAESDRVRGRRGKR